MLQATASVTQTYSPAADSARPSQSSLVAAPQAPRPIENSDKSATTRDRFDESRAKLPDARQGTEIRRDGTSHQVGDAPVEPHYGRTFNMIFDERNGRPIIEILNPRTGEVLDRIPPESLQERAEKDGLPSRANLVDETA